MYQPNNPVINQIINSLTSQGVNYWIEKNRGCKRLYNVWGLVFGLALFAFGIFGLTQSPLVGVIFIGIGLLTANYCYKELKKLKDTEIVLPPLELKIVQPGEQIRCTSVIHQGQNPLPPSTHYFSTYGALGLCAMCMQELSQRTRENSSL